jgi:DNA-binding NarL/FixJ family response regulator
MAPGTRKGWPLLRWPSPYQATSLYAERTLRGGARGYIAKNQPGREFVSAVRRVLGGEVYLSRKMSSWFLERIVIPGAKGVGQQRRAQKGERRARRGIITTKTQRTRRRRDSENIKMGSETCV